MIETSNWYILHTKSAKETKLARFLSRKGYEVYCPVFTEVQSWYVTGTSAQKVLFSCWVFVHCTQTQLASIRKLDRNIRIVYRLDQPAIVGQEEINSIKYALTHFRQLQLSETGIQSSVTPILMQRGTANFALPSLGFTLSAMEKIEPVFQPDWITEETIQAQTLSAFQKNTRYLLRLPALVGSKVLKFTAVLSRVT